MTREPEIHGKRAEMRLALGEPIERDLQPQVDKVVMERHPRAFFEYMGKVKPRDAERPRDC